MLTALWVGMAAPAIAGSGPWVLGSGRVSMYAGTEVQRLTRLAITSDGERDVIDVGEGVSTLGLKAIGTVGLSPHLDVQLNVPWWTVQANRPDAELCGALGLGACRTTAGVGVLEARGKALLLDEFFGAPVSLAIGTELRAGQLTAATRERITNIGEGTTDVGAFAAVGRTGGLGSKGSWAGYVEAGGRYRFPTTRSYPAFTGDQRVPAPELSAATELLAGPNTRFALGPAAFLFWRPGGLDWGDLDLADVDRLGALRVTNLRAGGTLVVRGDEDISASISVLRTAVANNNPTDVLSVSAGVQVTSRIRRGLDGG